MSSRVAERQLFPRFRLPVLGAAAGGVLLLLLGAVISPDQFWRAYLAALLFWLGLALGSLGLALIHQLVGGTWGFVIRRLLEAAAATIPLLGVLFVPLLFGLGHLYRWAGPGVGSLNQHAQFFYARPFWIARAVAYFVIWSGLALLMNRWSRLQDQGDAEHLMARLINFSPPGLILLVLTVTFAWIDWVMALEPDWYSTIYGLLVLCGQGLTAMAFAILAAIVLSDREPLASALGKQTLRLNDLGNLLLTFVMLWAYNAFSQFLIIWYGNLPREAAWYLHRTAGGWKWIALLIIIIHFWVPFLLLLGRGVKRRPRFLASVAILVCVIHVVDTWWQVLPSFSQNGFALGWLDVIAPIAVGACWLAAWGWLLGRAPLLPLHDPRMPEGQLVGAPAA